MKSSLIYAVIHTFIVVLSVNFTINFSVVEPIFGSLRTTPPTSTNASTPSLTYSELVKKMSPLELLIWAEQNLYFENSGDPAKIHPATSSLEGLYRAQSRNWFELESYWVNSKDFQGLEADKIAPKIRQLFVKKDSHTGDLLYRLLVHPVSKKFYSKLLEGAIPDRTFKATATASERTLLVQADNLYFFAKVSLDRILAGTDRKIKSSEVAMSIGTTNILSDSRKELPLDFHFLPEVFAIYPKNEARGGMIIRELPASFFSNGQFWIPMFAFISTVNNTSPWLIQLVEKKGISLTQAVDEWIITPFVNQWLALAIEHGITMEPHGQNLLLGINNTGEPNGQWAHRDFGGFNIDQKYRQKLGKHNSSTPFVGSHARTYHSNNHDSQIYESLYLYFSGTILYDIEMSQELWIKNGWIKNENIHKGSLEVLLKRRLKERLFKSYGIDIDGRFGLIDVDQFVREAKRRRLEALRDCNQSLSKW